MSITIRTHHIDITEPLKIYAEKKIEKLHKFFENIQEITIELDIEDHTDENKRQVAMGTLFVPHVVLRAEKATKDMYASIDKLYEKLESQLRKHKEKVKKHKGAIKSSILPDVFNNKRNVLQQNIEKNYIAKPLSVDEAADIVETDSLTFLVFRNASTEKINVIYPLSKNEYGLIDP